MVPGSQDATPQSIQNRFAVLADEDSLTGEGHEEFAVATRAESGLRDHGRMVFPAQVSANRPKRLRLVGQFQRGSQATTIPAPSQSVADIASVSARSFSEGTALLLYRDEVSAAISVWELSNCMRASLEEICAGHRSRETVREERGWKLFLSLS